MRISADDFEIRDSIRRGDQWKVFLDGVEQTHAVVADEENGMVERCVIDADGLLQIDPIVSDRVWTEVRFGRVQITRVADPLSLP